MRTVVAVVFLSLVCAALAVPPSNQAKVDLPVTRVTIFSSGVGYFQREGEIEGDARVELTFPAADVNDLLKSLLVQDAGGGRINSVTYDNRNPIAMTLKSFAIDLTNNPTLADLLNQARGENAEIGTSGDPKVGIISENLTGTIVGVEKLRQPVGNNQFIELAQLNVLTPNGLRGIPMPQVQRVRFLKPSLEQEFRKALDVLATSHDSQKKTVGIHFTGNGKRAVKVGYVTEAPIWKTSYRLALDGDKAFLQGWAMVENTSDEDWNNVKLGLVSGRPISFKMDLYEPLYVPRPLVEPELFASLRPPSYAGDLDRKERAARHEQDAARKAPGAPMGAPAATRAREEAGKVLQKLEAKSESLNKDKLSLGEGVASAAVTTELGEFFQYLIDKPVTLPRQKSALIPIVNQDVDGSRVSIYNESVHAKYPLLGLRFKNRTTLHLAQGPVTVVDSGSYAGDARLPDLQPNETRLISFAVDLGTEVEAQQRGEESLQAIKIVKGILHATYKTRESKSYTVKNRSPQSRTVLIEHPFRSQFKLMIPDKPAERSRDVYRFEVTAAPDKPEKLEVVEELPRTQLVALTNLDDDSVRVYIRSKAITPQVKKALEDALALKAKLDATIQGIQKEEQALKVIEQDQARMRANMERVPPTSEAYKRYLKKFDEQETEIEKRRSEVARMQEVAATQRKAYEDYLAGLNLE